MFEAARMARTTFAAYGLVAAALATAFPGAVLATQAPVVLGVSYVEPPHKPGAKVRTPEGLASPLADRLAKSLPLKRTAVSAEAIVSRDSPGAASPADVFLLPLNSEEAAKVPGTVIPTGLKASILAIVRSDPGIRRWEEFRDKIACLAAGGGQVGQIHAQNGAQEIVFRPPADALLNL